MFAWHDTAWMWLSMVVFWSVLVVFAYFAIKGRTRPSPAQDDRLATEILEARYARGEMSAEQYRESRESLEATGAHGKD